MFFFNGGELPSLKLTFSPLKMDGWNTTFLLGWPIFKGYVSFREGMGNGFPPPKKRVKSTRYFTFVENDSFRCAMCRIQGYDECLGIPGVHFIFWLIPNLGFLDAQKSLDVKDRE